VFASQGEIAPWLVRYGEKVSIAALNGPSHTVISGEAAALEAVLAELSRAGFEHQALRVSHAFHSPLMRGAAAAFERFVARFELRPPRVPLLSNLTGAVVEQELLEPAYWARQLCEPVRFADGIEAARRAGCDHFLELGPRPSLLGLAAAVLGSSPLADGAVALLASLRPAADDWTTVSETVARLYAAGLSLSWQAFHQGADRRRVVLPTYPFQRQRYWVDPPVAAKLERVSQSAAGAGPLLARVAASPLIPQLLWQAELSALALPLLSDHRVFERVVVSGACHLALIIDVAIRQLGAAACELRDVVFARALQIPEQTAVRVQLVLEPLRPEQPGEERYGFRLISVHDAAGEGAFVDHAEGVLVLRRDAPARPLTELGSLRALCSERLSVDDLYGAQLRRRIELGPSYRWLSSLARGAGQALG